jgi:hypothetical protein
MDRGCHTSLPDGVGMAASLSLRCIAIAPEPSDAHSNILLKTGSSSTCSSRPLRSAENR